MSKILLTVLLNVADGFVILALIFGGWNATNVSGPTGYATMAAGIVLGYLSACLWFGRKWQALVRLVLYAIAGTILLISSLIISIHEPVGSLWPVPVVLILILLNLLLSLIRQSIAADAPRS